MRFDLARNGHSSIPSGGQHFFTLPSKPTATVVCCLQGVGNQLSPIVLLPNRNDFANDDPS
jgi:hypothetical protein